ncbi:hypothetical protein RHSIM_Rhsim08G0201700 [Rhododendron simsii]|uniref:Ubiquitin receptor RAD23 n=1 Tax=Rhododendron simsii TaxID=118357 RepID=A0A834GKI1_RHOSS|nr:hypothetical protein RHSIM_Rhsim08G0201700 [Rhododendron simsii]
MESAFVGMIFDVLCGEVVNAIKEVRTNSKEFKPLLKQLESTVNRMTPIFEDIKSLNQAVHRPETEYAVFADQRKEGKSLVLKCAGVRWWNKSSYAKKLIAYDRSLTRFFQMDVSAQILHTFLALSPLLKENPHILKLTLQGLREKDPDIFGHIKENKAEFFQLIYGPEADISKIIEDLKDVFEEDGEQEMTDAINVSRAEQETPHTISVILAEQEAIERVPFLSFFLLEEMGFDRDLVIEAFLACDGNEELAVNYLLENAGYFED